jgi:high affinity choline transporter 7
MYNEHVGSLSPEDVDWIGRVEPSEYFYYMDYGLLLIFGGIPWQVSQRHSMKHYTNQLKQFMPVMAYKCEEKLNFK